MEYSQPQHETPSRFKEDFLIRSINTIKNVEKIESEVNAYRGIVEYEDEYSYEYYNSKTEELNENLSLDSAINCSVIGEAWEGNAQGITQLGSNTLSLTGVDFQGFRFTQDPIDKSHLSAMLMFTRGKDQAYYFAPKDVLYAHTEHHVDSEKFAATLKAHSDRHQEIIKSLYEFELSEQQDILLVLSGEPGEDIESAYGGKEVHIDADFFYRIDYDVGSKAELVEVDRWAIEDGGRLAELPIGYMQGCAFIEMVMADINEEDLTRFERLIENEACIVVTDENEMPTYLIPLSKFNDALELG